MGEPVRHAVIVVQLAVGVVALGLAAGLVTALVAAAVGVGVLFLVRLRTPSAVDA